MSIRLGSDRQFEQVRELLLASGYTETAVLARFAVEKMSELDAALDAHRSAPDLSDAFGVLITFFLDGAPVERRVLEEKLGESVFAALQELGLITGDDLCICPVALYPTFGLYIVSDRWRAADATALMPPPDAVFPAITGNTETFLGLIPMRPCESFLDLCSGTGIAALIAARDFAKHSYAFDIAERSTLFGEFNRRLNAIPNATFATGDLYEPAGDTTFDCVVVHPPYVPVLRPKWIFHDGGEDGELILRRAITELPRYLRPGGRFFMLAMGTDRKEAAYEHRIREWLDGAEGEFDIALITRRLIDPAQFAVRSLLKGVGPADEIHKWKALFASLHVNVLVYGSVILQRKTESRPAFTVRRQKGKKTGRAEMEWLLEWEASALSGTGVQQVLRSALVPAPDLELRVLNKLVGGEWQAGEYNLQVDYPFSMETQIQPWFTLLLSRCDAVRTGLDHLRHLKEEGIVHPDTRPEEFAQALLLLVSGGFVRVSERAAAG
jgi:SAM-dependent methyltransferase